MALQFVCIYSLLFWNRTLTWVIGSFYRQAIPTDITQGSPDPSKWGPPVAALDPTSCDLDKYFANHSVIFGGWISTKLFREFLT